MGREGSGSVAVAKVRCLHILSHIHKPEVLEMQFKTLELLEVYRVVQEGYTKFSATTQCS